MKEVRHVEGVKVEVDEENMHLVLRISTLRVVMRHWRSQWNVCHGVRGCHDQVKEVPFHKLAKLKL